MDEKQDATPSEPQATSTEPQSTQIVRSDEAKKLGGVTGKGFMPGKSGNPNGRPKRTPLTDVTREKLPQKIPDDPQGRTYAEAIVDKLIAMALSGDIAAIRELHDRAEGKARQTIDIGNAALREAYERLSAEEVQAWQRGGEPPAWWPRGELVDE
jgi:hypothetical protein